MNDRIYTVIFWGAISLTLHALIIAFAPQQTAVSDAGGMAVTIVRTQLSPAAAPAAAPSKPPAPPRPTQASATDDAAEPATALPQPSLPEDAVQAEPERKETLPVVTSSNGVGTAPPTRPLPKEQPVVAKPAPAPPGAVEPPDANRPPETTELASEAAASETAAIIERLVGEDEREVAERLAEIPTTDSPYWTYLMQRLAQPKWHHQQFNFRSLKRQRTLAVDLEFYPNGIVRAARIARSSGLEDLDAAAIRASYAAAPYTPPPPEDRQYGYTYRIKLKYMPSAPAG